MNVYECIALTGGTSNALDAISWYDAADGDMAFVTVSQRFYVFRYDGSSSDAEDVSGHPYTVKPDDAGANNGRWKEATAISIDTDALTITNAADTYPFDIAGSKAGAQYARITHEGNQDVGVAIRRNESGGSYNTTWQWKIPASQTYLCLYNGADLFKMDTGGNAWLKGSLTLGGTQVGVYTGYSMIQVGGNAVILAPTSVGASKLLRIAQNANYDTDGSWEYISTDEASLYQQYNGIHDFKVAASGTAGTDISWTTAMQIDNAGDVWMVGDCSALSFTDRTPMFAGDACEAIKGIAAKADSVTADLWGELDHDTLPAGVLAVKIEFDRNEKPVTVKRRNLSNMVSLLTRGVQEIVQRIEALESK